MAANLHQTDKAEPTDRTMFIEPNRVGFTHQVLAEALAEPGFSVADAKAFIRNMRAAGYVKSYTRGRADKRQAHLYRPDAALALGLLHRASEAGFASPKVRSAIGLAVQRWRDGDDPTLGDTGGPLSPGVFVMSMFAQGQRGYVANVAFFHKPGQADSEVGVRMWQQVGDSGRGTSYPHESEELEMRSLWTCQLDPILSHLMRRRGATH